MDCAIYKGCQFTTLLFFCAFWFVILFWPILGPFWCLVVTLVTFSTNLHIYLNKKIPTQKNSTTKKSQKEEENKCTNYNKTFVDVLVCFCMLCILTDHLWVHFSKSSLFQESVHVIILLGLK